MAVFYPLAMETADGANISGVHKPGAKVNKSDLVPGSATKMSSFRRARASCVLPFHSRVVDRSLLGRPVPWKRGVNNLRQIIVQETLSLVKSEQKARFNGKMEAKMMHTCFIHMVNVL